MMNLGETTTHPGLRFVNLTPHPLTWPLTKHRRYAMLPCEGEVCALVEPAYQDRLILNAPCAASLSDEAKDLTGLPEPRVGHLYVVPLNCLPAARRAGRRDVLAPGPGSFLMARRDADDPVVELVDRLLWALEPRPRFVVLHGSATHAEEYDDVDLIASDLSALSQAEPEIARLAKRAGGGLDVVFMDAVPGFSDSWLVRTPAFGVSDKSEPRVLWSDCDDRLRVRRRILYTKPAILRAWSTCESDDVSSLERKITIEIGVVKPFSSGPIGSGPAAWRRALRKVPDDRIELLPTHLQELRDVLNTPGVADGLERSPSILARRARSCDLLERHVAESPGSTLAAYEYRDGGWHTPKGAEPIDLAETLRVWSSET